MTKNNSESKSKNAGTKAFLLKIQEKWSAWITRGNRVDAAIKARNWAATLLAIFIGIKIVLFFTEPSIHLAPWEWVLIWPAMLYQHAIVTVLLFGLYFGLFLLARKNRPLEYVCTGVAGFIQVLLPFLHISSLRVVHVVGSYTTFEMTQADSEGSIFTQALLDVNNLPYTISGAVLSISAVLLPVLLLKRAWKRQLSLKAQAIAMSAIILIGFVSSIVIRSYVSIADRDPIIFYYSDMIEKKMAAVFMSGEPQSFETQPLFGDPAPIETSKLFSNLDKWRKSKKNVILFVLESLPAKQASFMGRVRYKRKKRDTMPNIRELKKHTMLWKNHYTVHPSSMNSLFSIGCSLYPYPPGDNITSINPRIPCYSISEVMADQGYKTALYHSGKFSFWKKLNFYKRRGFDVMQDAKSIPGHQKAEKFHWGIDEFTTAKAIVDFIEKNKNNSFFVQYINVFPHSPYDYLEGDWAIFPKKRGIHSYHNCLRYADAAIKEVVDGVRKLGLEDDTLLIFVGDHGEAFYEHPGNRVHSIYIYEENVHVAMAMVNPVLFPKYRSTHRVTSHIDILPTVAALIDAKKTGPVWQGQSILQDGPSRPIYFFANWGQKLVGTRDGKYKAIWEKRKNDFEVFDLSTDPSEKKNIADRYPNRLGKYRDALRGWWTYQANFIANFGKTEAEKEAYEEQQAEKKKRKKKKKKRKKKEKKTD